MPESSLPPELQVEVDGPIAVVTMNRPDQLNAANAALHRALVDLWSHLVLGTDARVVVLTGAGRAFSAGGDLDFAKTSQTDAALRRRSMEEARRTVLEMVGFPLPIISAVNGPAVGFGCSLALMSDLVVMSEETYFSDPHLQVGLVAGDGAAMVMPALAGLTRTKEFIWSGRRMPAAEALELGLVTRVVPAGEVLDQAMELAGDLAKLPAQALQDTKRVLNLPLRQAVTASLELAIVTERESITSEEHKKLIAGIAEQAKKKKKK